MRAIRIIVLMCIMSMLSGCGFSVPLPGANLSSAYTTNRSGDFYAGTRCSINLVNVAAVWSDQVVDTGEDWPQNDRVVWAARADLPGVVEFLLFKGGQPGVTVTTDRGVSDRRRDVQLYIKDSDGYIYFSSITMNKLKPGMVGPGTTTPQAVMTWKQYKDMDESLYGCKTVWGGR